MNILIKLISFIIIFKEILLSKLKSSDFNLRFESPGPEPNKKGKMTRHIIAELDVEGEIKQNDKEIPIKDQVSTKANANEKANISKSTKINLSNRENSINNNLNNDNFTNKNLEYFNLILKENKNISEKSIICDDLKSPKMQKKFIFSPGSCRKTMRSDNRSAENFSPISSKYKKQPEEIRYHENDSSKISKVSSLNSNNKNMIDSRNNDSKILITSKKIRISTNNGSISPSKQKSITSTQKSKNDYSIISKNISNSINNALSSAEEVKNNLKKSNTNNIINKKDGRSFEDSRSLIN